MDQKTGKTLTLVGLWINIVTAGFIGLLFIFILVISRLATDTLEDLGSGSDLDASFTMLNFVDTIYGIMAGLTLLFAIANIIALVLYSKIVKRDDDAALKKITIFNIVLSAIGIVSISTIGSALLLAGAIMHLRNIALKE